MRLLRDFLVLLACCTAHVACAQTQSLNNGWEFESSVRRGFRPAMVPGTLQENILAQGDIPDPYVSDNIRLLEPYDHATATYRLRFAPSNALMQQDSVFLQFEGLDTYADVWLNGRRILQADNMFRLWEVPVKSLLKEGVNELRVVFHPAADSAKKLKAAAALPYPENERVFVRKAQYHFGWDFSPRVITCGIWKPVRLSAKRWTPQPARVSDVRLVNEPDSIGAAFYFTRGGRPIYIKGANWVPCDVLLPRAVREDKYRELLIAAKEANINMLRVWGGGIYEDDRFYDLCDSLGLMVWQDFPFACAMYPGDSAFLRNVEAEVRYQVARLRRHPSLAIWCGNNENAEGWFNWGWQRDLKMSKADSAKLWQDYQTVFYRIIPMVLKELDPERPYWSSSPSYGWGRDTAYKAGDVHYWGVWWGKEPVEKYRQKVGRFVSEYGMQSYPDAATVALFRDTTKGWADTASAAMKAHQLHPFGLSNLLMYVGNRQKIPTDFNEFMTATQDMQAAALAEAINAHRAAAPYNMGTILWQFNDSWPGITWSIVDYSGRKKRAYYRVRELYQR